MSGDRSLRPARQLRFLALTGLVALGAATLAACGGSSSTPSGAGSPAAGGAAHDGGSLTLINSVGTGLDPAHNLIYSFADAPGMEMVYGPGLVYETLTGSIKMGFATSLTASDNNTVWTVKLHPGLKFSDGTAFNAQAVIDNLNRIADPKIGSEAQKLAAAIKGGAPDATTAVFTLSAPDAQFPSVLADEFSMIPSPTAVAKYGTTYNVHPVGAGPFELQSITPSESMKFTANPLYKNFAPGQPHLSSITVEEVDANPQAVADLQTGQAQVDSNLLNGQIVQQARGAGMTVVESHPVGGAWLDMNQARAPFNNILAREAVYLALSRKGVANVWAQGNPVATNFFPSNSPDYNPADNYPAQDKAKAQQLFNELAAQGHPVTFSVIWPQGTFAAAPQYIASTLNQFKNVHVTADIVTLAQYQQAVQETGNYQMTADGLYDATLFPQIDFYFQNDGAFNLQHINDPTLNADLLAMQNASGTAFKSAVDKFLQRIISQWDLLPTQQGDIGYAYNAKEVGGVQVTSFGIPALYGQMYLLHP